MGHNLPKFYLERTRTKKKKKIKRKKLSNQLSLNFADVLPQKNNQYLHKTF